MVKNEIVTIAKSYIDAVALKFAVKSAYIFVSYVKGTSSADSDIDVAVVIDGHELSFEKELDIVKLRRSIDLRIEPHPFLKKDFNEENPMALEILKTSIRLI